MSSAANAFNPLANYRQVEQFELENDSDEDEEEKTIYITLDLGQLDPSLLPNATSYKLIGLETPTPFIQIGGSTFKGNYESLLGTEIILQESPHSATSTSSRVLQPVATTSNRIRFKEVHLVPKTYSSEFHGDRGEGDAGVHPNMRTKTLGGVSREKTEAFFPISNGAGEKKRAKRRWHKRPEGYHTDDEKEKGPGDNGTVTSEENGGGTEITQNAEGMDVESGSKDGA